MSSKTLNSPTARDVLPKAEALTLKLQRDIESGVLRPGDRLPSFTSLQAEFGASTHTIERALNALEKNGFIQREKRRGVFVAPPRTHTNTNVLGFCGWGYWEKPRTYYWTHLLEGVQEVAIRQEKGLMLLDPGAPHGWDKVDGVLTSNIYSAGDLPLAPEVPRLSLLYAVDDVPCVTVDNYRAGYESAQHLIELGHRRIACLGMLDSPLVRQRLAGYREALREAGVHAEDDWIKPFGPVPVPEPGFKARGAALMSEWLQQGWKENGCTAILAQNDLVAVGAMEILQGAGIAVPGEVSVMGFNGTEICDAVLPRLSSMEVPLREIGMRGAELLLEQIEGNKQDAGGSLTILPAKLVARDSTAPVAS